MERILPLIFIMFAGLAPAASLANPVQAEHIEVELLSEADVIRPGESFWVAIRLTPEKNWHVYWRNPGDSGNAPESKWTVR
ncbi:MAG: hypothetical protein AAF512_13160 [Pseudomonadota bacterium]